LHLLLHKKFKVCANKLQPLEEDIINKGISNNYVNSSFWYEWWSRTQVYSLRFRYSFFCQGTSTRRQRRDFFSLLSQAATCYYQSNHSKIEAISFSALPKDTTSELTGLSPH